MTHLSRLLTFTYLLTYTATDLLNNVDTMAGIRWKNWIWIMTSISNTHSSEQLTPTDMSHTYIHIHTHHVILNTGTGTFVLARKSLLLAGKWPDRHQTCTGWTPGEPVNLHPGCARDQGKGQGSRDMRTFFGFLEWATPSLTVWLFSQVNCLGEIDSNVQGGPKKWTPNFLHITLSNISLL